MLSACDDSPLLFTHGLFWRGVACFPDTSCFRHKITKAVILTAVKRPGAGIPGHCHEKDCESGRGVVDLGK